MDRQTTGIQIWFKTGFYREMVSIENQFIEIKIFQSIFQFPSCNILKPWAMGMV